MERLGGAVRVRRYRSTSEWLGGLVRLPGGAAGRSIDTGDAVVELGKVRNRLPVERLIHSDEPRIFLNEPRRVASHPVPHVCAVRESPTESLGGVDIPPGAQPEVRLLLQLPPGRSPEVRRKRATRPRQEWPQLDEHQECQS